MKPELDQGLVKDFPLLYADRFESSKVTCMCWGFECPNEWEPTIRRLSEKLEPLIERYLKENPADVCPPRASQVKEKYGGLRFYMTTHIEEFEEPIEQAEREIHEFNSRVSMK